MNFERIDLSWIREPDGKLDVDKIVAFGLMLCFGVGVAFGV